MTESAETLPDRGHNNPPELLPLLPLDPDAEKIAEAYKAFIAAREKPMPADLPYKAETWFEFSKRVSDFCDAAGAWADLKQIGSEAQAERLNDFITGASRLEKAVDAARVEAKEPWKQRGEAVDAAFNPLRAKLDKVALAMKPLKADWLKREKDRKEREAAEKKRLADEALEAARKLKAEAEARNDFSGAAEAEALEKAAQKDVKKADKPVRVSVGSATGAGRASGLRTVWHAEITNIRAVFMHFQDNPRVVEVLQSLADAEARGGREVPGAIRKSKEVV